jgi:hypothetical protein
MDSNRLEVSDQVRIILGVLGVYLILVGFIATAWSARAAFGQQRYADILMKDHDPETELRLARQAFRGYSHSYALCILAAEAAFKAAESATAPESASRFYNEAEYWVTRGLDLNPWLMELHYLKARLLVRRDSPAAAVTAWRDYSEWHFWDPRNLEILAQFQEDAGQWDEAMRTMEWLKPWPQYDAMRERIRAKRDSAPAKTGANPVLPSTPVEPAAGRL